MSSVVACYLTVVYAQFRDLHRSYVQESMNDKVWGARARLSQSLTAPGSREGWPTRLHELPWIRNAIGTER